MGINIELLAEICEASGAPGHEQKIREIVIREVAPLADEVRIDNMGNVTAIKKGEKNKKVVSPRASKRTTAVRKTGRGK